MTIDLMRDMQDTACTQGKLAINGLFACFTLEPASAALDPTLDHPCIPAGTYPVQIQYSPKFKRLLPHILNVPGRSAIEIHAGNIAGDTEGCVLVGLSRAHDSIVSAALALGEVQPPIAGAQARGESITITVSDPPQGAV